MFERPVKQMTEELSQFNCATRSMFSFRSRVGHWSDEHCLLDNRDHIGRCGWREYPKLIAGGGGHEHWRIHANSVGTNIIDLVVEVLVLVRGSSTGSECTTNGRVAHRTTATGDVVVTDQR